MWVIDDNSCCVRQQQQQQEKSFGIFEFLFFQMSKKKVGRTSGQAGICLIAKPGNTNCRGRLSTVDLLIEVACFVKN
jgi:hypothetical protein